MTPNHQQPASAPLFCWSCGEGLTSDCYVFLGEGHVAPCCAPCWRQMSVEQRIKTAQMLKDRAEGGYIDAIATVFKSSFGNFVEQMGGIEWMRGRDGN